MAQIRGKWIIEEGTHIGYRITEDELQICDDICCAYNGDKSNAQLLVSAPVMYDLLNKIYENDDVNNSLPDHLLQELECVLNSANCNTIICEECNEIRGKEDLSSTKGICIYCESFRE